jgi:hypothetical protein
MPYRIPSKEDYKKSSGGNYGTLAVDDYIVQIESYDENRFQEPGKYNTEREPRVWFFLKPLSFADDPESELIDDEGNPVNPDKSLLFVYDPKRLGLIPQVAKSRKFLAAALGVPVDDEITFDGYDELIGKTLIVSVSINGNGNNSVVDVRPVKKRTRVRTTTDKQPTLAAKAEEIFGDDVAKTSEDDGEY